MKFRYLLVCVRGGELREKTDIQNRDVSESLRWLADPVWLRTCWVAILTLDHKLPVSDFVQNAALQSVTSCYPVDPDRHRSATITTCSGALYGDSAHLPVEKFV